MNTWHPWLAAALAAFGLHGAAAAAGTQVDGEIIVQLKPGSELSPLLVKHQLSLTGRFGARPIYRLKVIGDAKVKDKVDALLKESAVRSAEPNVKHAAPEPRKNVAWTIGDEQGYAQQWAPQAIRLAQAHALSTGSGVRIALLDTGVDAAHPALAGRLLPGFDFVDFDNDPSEVGSELERAFGHGTHVAGLLALVAPQARIMPLRILDADGVGNAWVLAEAMLHAVDPDGNPNTNDGAQVINLSVGTLAKTQLFKTVAKLVTCRKGGGASVFDDDDDDKAASADDTTRCNGFGGAVVVAAAGNRGSDKVREFPAGEDSHSLLSVAASDNSRWLARFSNYGWVKAAAPGDGITSSVPGGGYATWGGTSMAAALASGAAALLRAAEPELSADKVVKRLEDRGQRLCGTNLRQIDVAAALGGDETRDQPPCSKDRP
jgi:subtilisin family serine protease